MPCGVSISSIALRAPACLDAQAIRQVQSVQCASRVYLIALWAFKEIMLRQSGRFKDPKAWAVS